MNFGLPTKSSETDGDIWVSAGGVAEVISISFVEGSFDCQLDGNDEGNEDGCKDGCIEGTAIIAYASQQTFFASGPTHLSNHGHHIPGEHLEQFSSSGTHFTQS
eukprot:CAMPEP_0178967182 /NCGR_PEP_ID=MMETSP0789-20121207/17420_1 /TAXON_ID=3005 /ORGANISM="Rhizosolenia setigera, Strain CCMP 1694" /LENGTH=103 /DNA_ID=CAMNT_0020652699 /DNA_START=295 /DNA_END=606 /DNA_ORIENTATION=-